MLQDSESCNIQSMLDYILLQLTFNSKNLEFDPNCLKKNPNGGCLNCSRGFFLDNNSVCKQVNPLCKGADLKGLCIDCYPGYTLVSGACVIGRTKVQNNCFKV